MRQRGGEAKGGGGGGGVKVIQRGISTKENLGPVRSL